MLGRQGSLSRLEHFSMCLLAAKGAVEGGNMDVKTFVLLG